MKSSDYPQEFSKLYATALERKIAFTLDDEKLAVNTQHRLHAYRRALVNEDHPWGTKFQSVVVRRKGPTLTMLNRDSQLSEILASVELDAADPTDEELDKYLSSLGDDTNVKDK